MAYNDVAAMAALIDGLDASGQIWIDMTAIPKQQLAMLLLRLSERGVERVVCVYTFPLDYRPWTPKTTRLHSPTTREPEPMVGFTGSHAPTKGRALIVQLGFEGERALRFLRTPADPDLAVPVVGLPPLRPGWDQRSITENRHFIDESEGGIRYFAPADDPFANRLILDDIAAERGPQFNISVCPLGTKPQALGAILHALGRRGTALVYDFPSDVVRGYSEGAGVIRGYDVGLTTVRA